MVTKSQHFTIAYNLILIKEASKIMHRNTYAKALNELVSHGFIDIVRSGSLNKECNIFALSHRWKRYGTPHFEEGKRTVINPNWKA